QWLYDLIREVVEVHRGFPGPTVVATNGGSLLVIRPPYPTAPYVPEALRPVQVPVTPMAPTPLAQHVATRYVRCWWHPTWMQCPSAARRHRPRPVNSAGPSGSCTRCRR